MTGGNSWQFSITAGEYGPASGAREARGAYVMGEGRNAPEAPEGKERPRARLAPSAFAFMIVDHLNRLREI